LKGGQTVEAAAPLERIPLYLRNGRALPIRAGDAVSKTNSSPSPRKK
jgi:alpha-glucosidase (family GH31 glycosyl hydrolase)